MGTPESGKVIPFSPAQTAAATAGAPAGGDPMRDLALARRRGLDCVEPILRTKPAAVSPATPPAGASPAPGRPLDAPALSAMFIASLDDLICQRQSTWTTDAAWPAQADRQLEKVAIDIVDMLFGFILEDPQIPGGVKEALLSTQLPTLRMAAREASFFADWQHPVRQFLNDISPLFREHRERGGDAAEFAAFFAGGIAHILDELNPQGTAFAIFHGNLRDFVHGTMPKSPPEQAAWERAEAAARSFLERPLPQLARDFVAAHWIDVLEHTAGSHADDSPQWQDAIAVVEELAWSLTPKGEEERFHLISLIPALLTRLNRGLDLIDLPQEERRPFFDALIDIHATMLRPEEPNPATVPDCADAGRQVARLARGDWVEFSIDDGSRVRERVTWISPQRGILVFSNHQGQRALQITPEDLVDLVRRNKATLVFDQPEEAGRNSA